MAGHIVSHRWEFMLLDQDVYVYSRGKQQRQGYFDAKMPAVSDDDTDEFHGRRALAFAGGS